MLAEAPVRTVLFPHQIEAIKFSVDRLKSRGGAYINHSPGMGKSLSAICVARLLKVEKILVVTTLAGVGVWRQEVAQWWPIATPMVGRPEWITWSPLYGTPEVEIVNYDKLDAPRTKYFVGREPDLLILDEAQKVKNGRAKRSRAVQKIRKASKHVLLLSGTPAHTPLDYHAQLRLIAPTEKPWSLTPSAYKRLICNLAGPYMNWLDPKSPFKRDEVAKVEAQLALHMHKATKEELHLPEPIRTIVPVQLSTREWAAYREMEKRLRVELAQDYESTAPIILTKILRLQQITSGFLRDTQGVDHWVGTSKLDVLEDLLGEREHQKVVVAYRFDYERDQVLGLCVKLKRPCAPIDGSVSEKDRSNRVLNFQLTPEPFVLVLQAQAGGTAITLTAADTLIKFSQIPSVIDNTQLEGRVHRIGTTKFVQIIDLLAEGTIDQELWSGLKAKADLVSLASLLRKSINA